MDRHAEQQTPPEERGDDRVDADARDRDGDRREHEDRAASAQRRAARARPTSAAAGSRRRRSSRSSTRSPSRRRRAPRRGATAPGRVAPNIRNASVAYTSGQIAAVTIMNGEAERFLKWRRTRVAEDAGSDLHSAVTSATYASSSVGSRDETRPTSRSPSSASSGAVSSRSPSSGRRAAAPARAPRRCTAVTPSIARSRATVDS